jgi:hypothetical protein
MIMEKIIRINAVNNVTGEIRQWDVLKSPVGDMAGKLRRIAKKMGNAPDINFELEVSVCDDHYFSILDSILTNYFVAEKANYRWCNGPDCRYRTFAEAGACVRQAMRWLTI